MSLERLAEKVAEYDARLAQGKADRIRPGDVREVLGKLRKKIADLEAEMVAAGTDDRKARLDRKLSIAREHMARAEWLLDRIT